MRDEVEDLLKNSAHEAGLELLTIGPPGGGVPMQILVKAPETMDKREAVERLRRWSMNIRSNVPDSEEGWAWSVIVLQDGPLGFLWGGWKGREDLWTDESDEEASNSDEWQRLYHTLSEYLKKHGVDNVYGDGDFFLRDENLGHATQYLRINNVEVLTLTLIADLQDILRNGFGTWSIWIDLDPLPPAEGQQAGEHHLIIRADRLEEAWDKSSLRALLGSRFKL